MQIPASFEYERATSVEHALELLQSGGPEARLLAGGHSLLPMMKLRLASPELLIDLDDLAGELGYVREEGGEVRIGAMTRHRELLESALLASRLAIFTDAERLEELQAGARDGAAGGGGLAGVGAVAGGVGGGGGGPMDDILIEELDLGVRCSTCLKRAGVQTVGELLQKSESELAAIPNFGRESIDEVVETLKSRGLDLRES